MDVKIPVTHKATGLDFILHVTAMHYESGHPGTGPTYSCGGTPPEPAEAYPTEGYVELDGDVFGIVDITSADMDVIMQMTNDNQALFDMLCDEYTDEVYDALVDYRDDEYYSSFVDESFHASLVTPVTILD